MSAYALVGGETTVNGTYAGTQHESDVTVLADGRYVVIWLTGDTSAAQQFVMLRVFAADGTPLGGDVTVGGSTEAIQNPTITALAGGGFVAAATHDGTTLAQVFGSNGAPIGGLITVATSGLIPEIAALANGGFAISWNGYYSSGDTSGSSVHMRTYAANGAPTSGDVLVNTTTLGEQDSASITALAGGGLVVTWHDNGNTGSFDNDRIKAQIFDAAGARVGSEFNVNLDLTLQAAQSRVTALANGNFAVAWLEYDAALGSNATHVQIFTATGARVGSAIEVPYRNSLSDAGWPEIAELANGDIAIVWTANGAPTSDGSDRGIFVQVFEVDGTPASATMQVNTQANGAQRDPAIAPLANGGFIITWTDFNGSGANDDQVKAQIFGPPDEANPIVITSDGGGDTAALSIGENTGAVTTVAAAGGLGPLSYAIAGGADDARFSINATTGALTVLGPPDFEAPTDAGGNNVYDVVVSVSDGTRIDTQAIAVTVTNASEAPVISSNGGGASASIAVSENATAVTTVVASESGVTYAIAGGADAARFAIDASTGALSFVAAPNFEAPNDAGANNVYNVTVSASAGSLTDTQALSVTVGNVNEAPMITSNGGDATAVILVNENTTAVTTVTSSDPENSGRTYSIAGGADAARFSINSSTGALRFQFSRNFEVPGDAGGDNVYDVIVRASDGSLSDTQALAVTVVNVNEFTPVISSNGGGTSASISVSENATFVTTVVATDGDLTAPTYSISGGLDAARFTIDSSTGALSFVAAPNFEAPTDVGGNNVYNITVRASDGSLFDNQTLTITVTNANEAPVITSDGGGASASLTVNENSTFVTTVASTDPENTTRTYSISGGADAARFTINASTGALSFVSGRNFEAPTDANADNIYEVTVRASDGSLSDTQALSVTVADVNEAAPVISSNGGAASANISVSENTTAVTTVVASDADGTAPTYSISGGADAALFAIDATTGALTFVSAPNFEAPTDSGANNVYNVTVSASDGSLADTQALAITVGNLNETPVITSNGAGATAALSINENGSLLVTTVAATDPENTARTYSIAGGADAARFTISSTTGQLSFIAAANFEAPADADADNVYEVTVQASDGTLSDTQALSVTVADVNEAVAITSGAAFMVAENGLAVTTVTATDLDGTAPSYSISGGADAALFAIDAVTGALSFLAAPNFEAPTDAGANNVYNVTVSASDGSLTDTQALTVTVGNVNEAPVITSNGAGGFAAISVNENSTAVDTVAASDPEGGVSYSLAGGADVALFTIDAVTGALSFITAPNFEGPTDAGGNNVYDVIVRASDGSLSDTQALAVTVADANEAPIITSNGGGASAAISVNENSTAVTTVAASDPDANGVTYAIAGGVDAAHFAINASTGALSFVSAPNFEAPTDAGGNNVYDVIVSASDGSLTDTQALAVTVLNANETPVITSNGGGATTAISVSENSTAVTIVTASDPEGGVTYAIAGGADAARFAIDASTGALTFVSAPNFEAPTDSGANNVYNVAVSASDGSLTDTQALTITVGNVNEAPVITSNGGVASAAISVTENSTAVTTVAASDPEGGVAYSIFGGDDAARFTINASTGALSFVATPDFEAPVDVGGNNVYDVIVRASDGSLSDTQAIAVTVANVNEEVTITSGTSFTVAENGLAVTTVTATDLDGTAPTYSIFGGADAARFTIDASTGALSFLAAPNFETPTDVGGNNVYDVIVRASDGSLSDDRALTIRVTNTNETPVITSNGGGPNASISVTENATAVATVVASDLEGGVTYSLAGGADAALFAIDATTGALSFIAAPNFEAPTDVGGNNVYDVIVRASDGVLADTQALSITVGNLNEAPAITSNGGGATAALTVNENGSLLVTTVAATDPENTARVYSIVGGADAALFAIDTATGALSFVSAPNFEAPADAGANNVYDVVVAASDGTLSDAQALSVTVANVNEAVTITSGTSFTVAENGLAVTTVTATDLDGTAPIYSITGGADAALFVVDAQTGQLSFAAAPDFEAPADANGDNAYEVLVSASDGSLNATSAITVAVSDVNESLSITSSSSAFALENQVGVTTVSAVDLDGDAVTYAIVGGADALLFVIDAETGLLSFAEAPDFEEPGDVGGDNAYELIVEASDGSLTDSQSLTVTVGNANETPVITSNGGGATAALTVNESGSLLVTTVAATDPENTARTYSILGGADAALFAIDAATGALSFVSAPNFEAPADAGVNNVYDVVVAASDGTLSDTQAVSVTVANVNEAVMITSGTTFSLAENGQAVTTVTATDLDGTALTYSIFGGADAARFTIDASTGALSFLAAPNFEAPVDADANNVYDVVVRASDGSLSDTQALTITVTDTSEAPLITSDGGDDPAPLSMLENTTAVTAVAASDPESAALSYSIAGGDDASLFTIDAATGALSFLAAPDFEAPADAGANNVYDVVVAASDGVLTDSQALAITVGNVNEAPTAQGALADVAVGTGEAFTFDLSGLSFNDVDGDQLTLSAWLADGSGLPAWLSFDGTSFSGTAPMGTPGDFEIEVRASDGSAAASALFTLSVAVTYNYVTGTAGMEILTGTSGRDWISGLGGQDLIHPGAGADYVDGGSGSSDAVIYSSALAGVSLSLTSGGTGGDAAGDVYVDIENAIGSAFDDVLEGNGGTNFINGGSGNDVLWGLGGADSLNGDGGSDILYGGDGNDGINQTDWSDGAADQIYGEGGDDTLKGGDYDLFEGGTGADKLQLAGNYVIARGSGTGVVADSNNTITVLGNLIGVEVDGGLAYDTLNQQSGYDVRYASFQNVEVIRTTSYANGENSATMTIDFASLDLSETLFYGYLDIVAGLDADTVITGPTRGGTSNTGNRLRIFGAEGNDTLTGSSPTVDQLFGNGGDDQLFGLGGADLLSGGAGADRLTGGEGADTFAFSALADSTASATDMILDFTRAQGDKISLTAIDANGQLAGDQAFAFIGSSAFSGAAGQLRFFQSEGDTFVEGDANGDGVGDFLFGIDHAITLLSSDFAL